MTNPLTVVHLASEMAPLVKVGGLADMVGALAGEQARRGHRVTVVLPRYRSLLIPSDWQRAELGGCEVPWGMGREPAYFERITPPGGGAAVLLVAHVGERRFFDRAGVYVDPTSGEPYPDSGERFLFFDRAALEGLKRLGGRIDVLHAHDHQAAWAPCFVRTHDAEEPVFRGMATVMTIHNLGYQGIHDPWVLGMAGFGRELFYPSSAFEFWGRVNSLKVGLMYADLLSTVSPRYAREIQSNGEFGFGLEGVLARRSADLRGILNGIDDTVWNPATDALLPHRYDSDHLEIKALDRAALAAECGFPSFPEWPLVGVVSRLVEQKGWDLVRQAEEDLLELEARFVVLGSGQPHYQELFCRLAEEYPDRFHYRAGHDEGFAHRIEGGCDLFLMPSRYEPCGLSQMYSLRYGTVPVVRETGGLADSVEEFDPLSGVGTGFRFQAFTAAEMVTALRRALAVRRQPLLWTALQKNGMARDFSWRASADGYDRLYADARARVGASGVPALESLRPTT